MPAILLCTKCGAAASTPRADCPKCGGRTARICSACGTQNSVVKNFCDQCGEPLTTQEPPAPPASKPKGLPAADIPATMIRRLPPPPPGPAGKPPNPVPVQSLRPPSPPPSIKAVPAAETAAATPDNPARQALNILAAFIGVAGAAYGVWNWRESRRPEILVPKLAVEYLESLRTRDYGRAYEMLSNKARQNCTQAEFRAARDETSWTWSDVRVVRRDVNALLVDYELKAQDSPPRTDHLLFIQENGRWVRPYNWTLLLKAEKAFALGDTEGGLTLMRTAATINPLDPLAWSALCEATYYRKAPQETAKCCLQAIELSRAYPSSLTLKRLYHLHAILADTNRHALGRPDKALEQYSEMLSFPDISPQDQCELLLARSQTYTDLSRPGEALADLDRSAQLCSEQNDLELIQRMRQTLSAPDPQ